MTTKAFLSSVIFAALCSAMVLPTSAQDPATDAPTLTIWWAQWDPAVGLQTLSEDFTKESGIVVKVQQIPWPSYQEQVFLNFGNKTTDFDIVIGDSQWLGRGADKGLYLELTDWIGEAVDLSTIHPLAQRYLMEYPEGSGRYYGAPCETDAIGFVYRKDWFEDPAEKKAFQVKYSRKLAPPDTWQEFRDIAEHFHRPDEKRYGTALLTGRGYDSITMGFQPFLWAWGGAWADPETFEVQGHVNGLGAVAGLEAFIDLLQFTPPGGESSDYFQNLDAFTNGSTAMVLDYFPFYPGIVQNMGDQAGFFVVPRNGDTRAISLGGQGFSVSTKTSAQQQELAKQFIAWFQRTEVQEKWITFPGCFTANTELLQSQAFREAYPFNSTFAESLDHLRDFWNVPVYNELLSASLRNLGEALDKVKTPQEALDQLAMEHELILRGAGLLK
ncbi:MAG: extracellular solute-binding protein [Candidatus Latescibacterota bacterium]|nr:extracellular solute-binding protein [Candidatus Latescibacterota bacterium]